MQNEKEYRKILSRPEARHRYWHIQKSNRAFFPDEHITFKIFFDEKTYELKVNHKNDIMTGQLYEKYRFLEGNRIIVKNMDGNYILTAPDTKLYPSL